MRYILTVYSRSAYREYLLPHEQERQWDISLPKEQFDQPADIQLSIKYRGSCPELLPSGMFTLKPAHGKRRFPLPMEAGEVYFLLPDSGGRLVLMVRVVEVAAPVFEIYSLNSRAPITIGSSAENLIIYDNGNAISEVHAAIMSKGEAHYLEDKSCNGIYINHRRMEGRSVLRFGDQIHIFGLLIVYLGNCIALDVSAAGLRIQNELLSLEISAMESVLTAALKIHNDMEGGAVFEAGFSGGNETVLKKLVGEEDETVLERLINEEDETVLERLTEEDDETALERLSDEEDDTVLERLTEEEDETALERLTDEEDETVFGRSRQTGN